MSEIHIPATLDEAASSLAGIARVLGVKEWERAAIIYAHTTNKSKGGAGTHAANAPTGAEMHQLGINKAAKALGISKHTVIKYRRIWVEDGGGDPSIKPGDTITLPDVPWPTQEGGRTRGSAANAASALTAALENETQREATIQAIGEVLADDVDADIDIGHKSFGIRQERREAERKAKGKKPRPEPTQGERSHEIHSVLMGHMRDATGSLTYIRGIVTSPDCNSYTKNEVLDFCDRMAQMLDMIKMNSATDDQWDAAVAALLTKENN